MSKQIRTIQIAAILGGLAVALGAFGAHGLKQRLSEDMLLIFETGVRYHFYHALALLALGLGSPRLWQSPWATRSCILWTLGITIFSGSLYLLAITGVKKLGAITPIGGVAFILGWICLALAASSLRTDSAESG